MAKKVLVNLDFNGNEIQNVAMQMLATAPASPTEGQFYYNSANKKAYQYDGTSWKAFGAEIVVDASFIADSTNPVQSKVIKAELDKKVDKVSGKGLSANDYTTAEKNKLSGIESGANKTTVDAALSATSTNPVQNKAVKAALDDKANANAVISSITEDRDSDTVTIMGYRLDGEEQSAALVEKATQSLAGVMSAADKTKLDGIASGANKTVVDSAVTASGTNPVSGKAVADYVGTSIAASDAMIFKGTLGTGGTVTALPTTYKTGWTYRVITAGTYAGQKCEIGDLIIALVDRTGSGNANADWTVAQTNIDGAITSITGIYPIKVDGDGSFRNISHESSGVASGEYGESGVSYSPSFGGEVRVPYFKVNDKGHIESAGTNKVTLPSNVVSESTIGLMSPAMYRDLIAIGTSARRTDNIMTNNATVVLSAGKTSVDIVPPTVSEKSIYNTVVDAYATIDGTYQPVIVDWAVSNTKTTVSIAKAVAFDINIKLTYYLE